MTRDINVNPYPEMMADFRNGLSPFWIETNEETYNWQLGCLPPARRNRGVFAVGEAHTHTSKGAIHAVFAEVLHGENWRYFATFAPLADFDADLYRKDIFKQYEIHAVNRRDGIVSTQKVNEYEGSKRVPVFYTVIKNCWSTDIFNARIRPGESIQLTGKFFNFVKPLEYNITFKIGDSAIWGSYNLSYIGKITAIGEKTITIQHRGSKEVTRLDLGKFANYNFNFDLAKVEADNAIESQYI